MIDVYPILTALVKGQDSLMSPAASNHFDAVNRGVMII